MSPLFTAFHCFSQFFKVFLFFTVCQHFSHCFTIVLWFFTIFAFFPQFFNVFSPSFTVCSQFSQFFTVFHSFHYFVAKRRCFHHFTNLFTLYWRLLFFDVFVGPCLQILKKFSVFDRFHGPVLYWWYYPYPAMMSSYLSPPGHSKTGWDKLQDLWRHCL